MLLVRSMTSMTSTGPTGDSPHGPWQAAAETVPVDPWLTPTTRPNPYWVQALPSTTTTLHLSPRDGSHCETRVGPAPMKSEMAAGCPSELLGLQTSGTSRETYGLPVRSMPMRQR